MKRFYGFLSTLAFIGVVGPAWAAYAGPCTAQIAQLEQQINHTSGDPPSAPQSVGAQLGRQPTPQTVRDAEMQASAIARQAFQQIKKADAAGDAAGCIEALSAIKDLYGIR